jgi:peptidoglycan biosynthesis protein MviN/MurJ (putative lipid II flippase)
MLGVALGTILLPSLSKMHADEKPAEFSRCSTGACASR